MCITIHTCSTSRMPITRYIIMFEGLPPPARPVMDTEVEHVGNTSICVRACIIPSPKCRPKFPFQSQTLCSAREGPCAGITHPAQGLYRVESGHVCRCTNDVSMPACSVECTSSHSHNKGRLRRYQSREDHHYGVQLQYDCIVSAVRPFKRFPGIDGRCLCCCEQN